MKATARREKLDGKGCIWEDRLQMMGWNRLPKEEKVFELLNWSPPTQTFEAQFKDYTFICYPDEIVILKEETQDGD